jgi:hypothetical protein
LCPRIVASTAFGVFYTGTIGAGAVSPIIYGLFGNALGVFVMMALIAAVVLATNSACNAAPPGAFRRLTGAARHHTVGCADICKG